MTHSVAGGKLFQCISIAWKVSFGEHLTGREDRKGVAVTVIDGHNMQEALILSITQAPVGGVMALKCEHQFCMRVRVPHRDLN